MSLRHLFQALRSASCHDETDQEGCQRRTGLRDADKDISRCSCVVSQKCTPSISSNGCASKACQVNLNTLHLVRACINDRCDRSQAQSCAWAQALRYSLAFPDFETPQRAALQLSAEKENISTCTPQTAYKQPMCSIGLSSIGTSFL